MHDLSNTVTDYYFSHLNELSPEKKFHLASRLYLYYQDPRAGALLKELKDFFTANGNPAKAIQQVVTDARNTPPDQSKNAAQLRAPYFKKYPNLKAYQAALFRINFLQSAYGIDCRTELTKLFSAQELAKQRTDLLQDDEAMAILSTNAINFLYLYDRLIKQDDTSLPLEQIYQLGTTAYDVTQNQHLQLLIYLYTHCVIGETLFYARPIPSSNREIYQKMLTYLDNLIEEHFDSINLDNKFEFLVCAKIINYSANTTTRIMDEAARSISDEGHYLVDRHNTNPQHASRSLDGSEHRNALFMMSQREFTPLYR